MIELRNVERVYGEGATEVRALDGVSEIIDSGEHVAVVGPSGSGKSTLLHVIGALDRPTAGEILLDGVEIVGADERERSAIRGRQIGFVFQSYHLIARLDARTNVELPMMLAGMARAERRRAADEALDRVGLAKRSHHRPAEMSGGERQRVAIARAIVLRPGVLLADEPTGNLDRRSGGQVLELLEELHDHGLTLIVVTHDPTVARRAHRVLVMEDGRIERRIEGKEVHSLALFRSENEP